MVKNNEIESKFISCYSTSVRRLFMMLTEIKIKNLDLIHLQDGSSLFKW